MKDFTQKLLTAAVVAAVSFVAVGARASTTPTTPYVFRMPIDGLKAPATCPAGWWLMLPSSGTGSDNMPAGCSTVTFTLSGTRYVYLDGGSYVTVNGDEVDGHYAIPGGNATGTTVSYTWLTDGTVILSVAGVEIAVAAAPHSGDTSGVKNGATATTITYANSAPDGGWLQGNSGFASINAQ